MKISCNNKFSRLLILKAVQWLNSKKYVRSRKSEARITYAPCVNHSALLPPHEWRSKSRLKTGRTGAGFSVGKENRTSQSSHSLTLSLKKHAAVLLTWVKLSTHIVSFLPNSNADVMSESMHRVFGSLTRSHIFCVAKPNQTNPEIHSHTLSLIASTASSFPSH